MRPNRIENSDNAREFTDINNFKHFIFVTYQIRCNLFHGNKHDKSEHDELIVSSIFEPLRMLLEKIYRDEDYLQ